MSTALVLVLLLLGLAACAGPEVIGRQLCLQQCEADARDFREVEACRARCRESYAEDDGSG